MTGSNAGNSLGNMVKDSAKVVGGLGDAIRGNINSFADSAVDQTPKAQHNAAAGSSTSSSGYTTGTTGTHTGTHTGIGGTGVTGVQSRSAETGDQTAARGADAFRDGVEGLKSHGRTY